MKSKNLLSKFVVVGISSTDQGTKRSRNGNSDNCQDAKQEKDVKLSLRTAPQTKSYSTHSSHLSSFSITPVF